LGGSIPPYPSNKKKETIMSKIKRQYYDMIVVDVAAEISIKVTENERRLFDEHWSGEKKGEFVEKMFDKVEFRPNERIDSLNLSVTEEGV
tara:strand:+ start:478 stop:747 length:270 start_codon:yes stop_codon:yes gene_type:complete